MAEKFKVIVAGTRTFNDYFLLKKKLDKILKNKENIEIVSGGCRGTDKLGERYALDNNYSLKIFKADWKQFGNYAGPKRNKEMALYADALIAFWDDESAGTSNMIDLANEHKLLVRVIHYTK